MIWVILHLGIRERRYVKNICKEYMPSINMDREVFDDLKDLIAENYDIIYGNAELNEPYYEVIKPFMEKLYDRLVEDVEKRNFKSPVFQHYLNDTIQGKCYREKPRGRIIASPDDIVTDFIASMTDDYFVDICKYLHIDDGRIEKLKYHKYFDIT